MRFHINIPLTKELLILRCVGSSENITKNIVLIKGMFQAFSVQFKNHLLDTWYVTANV